MKSLGNSPRVQQNANLPTDVSSWQKNCKCAFIHRVCLYQFGAFVLQAPSCHACDDSRVETHSKPSIQAENKVEANKLVNNYRVRHQRTKIQMVRVQRNSPDMCVSIWQFGFRKWKSHVTERSFEDRSEVVKELYSDLTAVKQHTGTLLRICDEGWFSVMTERALKINIHMLAAQ